MKHIFLANVLSGKSEDLPLILDIEDAFIRGGKEHGFITEYITNGDEAFRAAKAYSEKYGNDCIVYAFGGDETASAAAAALAYTDTPMAFIPLDKKSDFAKKLYGERFSAYNSAEQLGLLSASPKMKIKKTDLGKCGDSYFINAVTMGIDVSAEEVSEKISEKLDGAEKLSDILGAAAAVMGKKRFDIKCDLHTTRETEGVKRRCILHKNIKYTFIAVTNSGYCRGGCASQFSVLNDGLLEMLVMFPCNFAEVCAAAPMFRKGAADAFPRARLIQLRGAEFGTENGFPFTVNIDGKSETVSSLKISAARRALKLCTSIFR